MTVCAVGDRVLGAHLGFLTAAVAFAVVFALPGLAYRFLALSNRP